MKLRLNRSLVWKIIINAPSPSLLDLTSTKFNVFSPHTVEGIEPASLHQTRTSRPWSCLAAWCRSGLGSSRPGGTWRFFRLKMKSWTSVPLFSDQRKPQLNTQVDVSTTQDDNFRKRNAMYELLISKVRATESCNPIQLLLLTSIHPNNVLPVMIGQCILLDLIGEQRN